MEKVQRPLKKFIFKFNVCFISILCVLFGFLTYQILTNSLYRSYNKRMLDILSYVENHIDMDDLSQCVDSKEESDKYKELMDFMDSIMEDFSIHYLYIVKPVINSETDYGMLNILTADTKEGRENDPDGYYLGFLITDDVYELDQLQLYQDALEKDGISFYKNFTYWGYDYTAAKPLVNSKGEHFALLCVDIEVADIQLAIRTYTVLNILLIVAMGIIFIIISNFWMNHYITAPIHKLEQSVVAFARRSHEQTDPELLKYEEPDISTKNEVEILSHAITKMTLDMQNYVKNVLLAEDQVENMKTQVTYMDMIAHQDALTHVKNKAWYDEISARIDEEIKEGRAKFGIIMADLNNLKKVNDNYGHEHGNDYISGACHELCVIYEHSPVFRIGGDEFVVLLQNLDYDNRDELLSRLKAVFAKTSSDSNRKPWEQYSVAVGQAIFDSNIDKSMNDVFKRADQLMYKDKVASRMGRE